MNTLKTGVLLAVVSAIAIGIGAYFFGVNGALIGLVIALALQAFSYFQGHKLALSFARAQELAPGALPWLESAVAELSQRAGIPSPKLYISPDPQPNAFAAGRNPQVAVVCLNQGLIEMMPRDQVIAVVAHEIGHIRNRDTLIMTVAAAVSSFINMLAYIGYLLPRSGDDDRNPLVDLLIFLLAPITATLIQLAISRTREYAADRTAAELLGTARPMKDALATLGRATEVVPSYTAQPQTAHMYIAAPFSARGLASLFSTHPKLEDRIRALDELELRAA